jgi:predicted metalloprotease with PDZ domain
MATEPLSPPEPAPVLPSPVHYAIRPINPAAHLFEVSCRVVDPDPEGQLFALPAWNPGSYMLREFARHVISVHAQARRRPLAINKIDKNTWLAARAEGPLTVTLQVYAWDLSVRGAHLDDTHAFFNGACVFLRPIGKQSRECTLDILPPRGGRFRSWRVATALRRRDAAAYGFGTYTAANYDELIDHPVEMGTFTLERFRAHGVPHDIVITGAHDADMRRLAGDLKRVCEAQIDLFGRPAPMDRYVFLITAVGEGYGGLEHRASTALLCARDDLPRRGEPVDSESYRTFLGLASHEYFHTWNVKRIRPAAFTPYDLDRENYTSLLWAFEGITSYYDDLMLVRAGLMSRDEYLTTVARSVTSIARTPARRLQSLADSSFDAWIKYYRQDENAPNAVVSYYIKGSLVALALDLTLRVETGERRSLDDLMRLLWRRYGKTGLGVPEDGIERAAIELVAGTSRSARGGARAAGGPGSRRRAAAAEGRMRAFFRRAIHGTGELPLAEMFARFGLRLTLRPAMSASDRGRFVAGATLAPPRRVDLAVRLASEGEARLQYVLDGGAAQRAGLAAGDTVVAIDGLRVNAKSFDARLQRLPVGRMLSVHFFRRDELRQAEVEASPARADTCDIRLAPGRPAPAMRRWLRGARR